MWIFVNGGALCNLIILLRSYFFLCVCNGGYVELRRILFSLLLIVSILNTNSIYSIEPQTIIGRDN